MTPAYTISGRNLVKLLDIFAFDTTVFFSIDFLEMEINCEYLLKYELFSSEWEYGIYDTIFVTLVHLVHLLDNEKYHLNRNSLTLV